MRRIAGMLALLVAWTAPAFAGGEWRGEGGDAYSSGRTEGPPFYAKGCYWRRGVRYCSLYCYEEINGKRYCNQRESEAVPQGDPYRPERPTVEEIYRQPRGYR
jgi:hypothetical protein